jgi:hypothetical protein
VLSWATNLVVDLGRALGDLDVDSLLEDIAHLVELDALGPAVKGAGNVDLFGGLIPGNSLVSVNGATKRQLSSGRLRCLVSQKTQWGHNNATGSDGETYHLNVWLMFSEYMVERKDGVL